MDRLRILVVEDEDSVYKNFTSLLAGLGVTRLESRFAKLSIDRSSSQKEAERKVKGSAEDPYRLVFLDLRYPEGPGAEITEDFRGLRWLPTLRSEAPDAVIIVFSAFGHFDHMKIVGDALRNGADDFIPKGTPWAEMELRIETAWRSARDRRDKGILQIATIELLRSKAAQVHLSDAADKVDRHGHALKSVATEVEQSFPDAAIVSGKIRGLVEQLNAEVREILKSASRRGKPELVSDVAGALRDRMSWYPIQCQARGVALEWTQRGAIELNTYSDDVLLLVHELLQNALCAAVAGAGRRGSIGKIEASFEPYQDKDNRGVAIAIRDNGIGFVQADLESQAIFAKDYSKWPNEARFVEHGGRGLDIARRLVSNLLGKLDIQNVDNEEGKGAIVTVRIPNLPEPAKPK